MTKRRREEVEEEGGPARTCVGATKTMTDLGPVTEVSSIESSVLNDIGKLRYECWLGEGAIDVSMFPEGVWLDDMDYGPLVRHWIVKELATNTIVGAARLTWHSSLDDDYRDVKLWREKGLALQAPVLDFGRLVVRKDHRRKGIARSLVDIRMQTAREWAHNGRLARTCVCTASAVNIDMLHQAGFVPIGQTATFADRPGVVFHALQCDL